MRKFLVIFDKNWNDEFDCQQFQFGEFEDFDKVVEELRNLIDEGGHGFGSNQGWECDEVELEDFRIRLLFDEEYDILQNLFPTRTFGTGIL